MQTGKPLTLRDVIAQIWIDDKWINKITSAKIYDDIGLTRQDEHVNLVPEHEYDQNNEISLRDRRSSINVKPYSGLRKPLSTLTIMVRQTLDLSL